MQTISILKNVYYSIQARNRVIRNYILRKRLTNPTVTIIGDNCNAGFIYHDLGLKFMSPTINLYIVPDDYIKFLNKFDYYIACEVEEMKDENCDFPVGLLDDVKIYFMHYKNFEEAKNKWDDRCKRINKNNMCIVMTQKSSKCQYKHLEAFDRLLYKNKIVFTNHLYKDIKSSIYIKGFEKEDGVGILQSYKSPKIFAKRYFEDFDYVKFLNNS